MKRLLSQKLLDWKQSSDRKPLILKGARQVGKTYLLQEFGVAEFRRCFMVNFEEHPEFSDFFEINLDPKRILTELSFAFKETIDVEQDLLIFDEIQACPKALTSLKYFCEKLPQLAVCAAGSLLGIHLNSESFPVGKVDWLQMQPMTFKEFLMALDEVSLVELLDRVNASSLIALAAHQQLWELLKHYFIVGGLPEVVSIYRDNRQQLYEAFQLVRKKQQNLIKDYYSDIAKHSGKVNAMHIDRTWTAVPSQLAKVQDAATKRFVFKGVVPGIDRYRRLVSVIDWLVNAGLILKVHVVDTAKQPLKAYIKESAFKLYMFDIGVLGAMSELDPEVILAYDYGSYKGYFAENYVCQELIALDSKPLYCWQHKQSELEFLKVLDGEVVPIEVKSGKSTHTKSLSVYTQQYQPLKSVILSANTKSVKNNKLFKLPLYLAFEIKQILSSTNE